ncbi:hypothetical protein [Hydrogenophaga sp.]|uniref:hypothetical protein n=1 Tax=Hydrogenophaga sp. TaxID=1904254 RepID=UPI002730F8F7|nr:hypothetical protein [Hydrogenophaga sp.]MDP2073269.1 hypothetical protein [Hydrogenophaga sp.]MDP3106670.1 hypothetical protein [Hydrogenophaga sp.]
MSRIHLPPEALALARWTALLMGWVWLGAQGQRLGWSVASGVLPVALWWALRLLFAQAGLPARLAPTVAPLLGAATALGALLVGQWQPAATGHVALLVLATVWAAWSASLDVPVARGACRRSWSGGPPLLAAALTALCTTGALPAMHSLWAAPVVLLLAAALGRPPTVPNAPDAAPSAASALPATAMGLMMGTLWLNNAWCSAAGWSPATAVMVHLGAMAALPVLTRLDLVPRHLSAPWAERLPLALLALGAGVLLAGTGATHGLVGMGLLALAWSVHAGRHRSEAFPPSPLAVAGWALCGPALLLAVGWLSPTTGPWAQQLAYSLIGGAALLALLATGWRPTPPHPLPLARSDSP